MVSIAIHDQMMMKNLKGHRILNFLFRNLKVNFCHFIQKYRKRSVLHIMLQFINQYFDQKLLGHQISTNLDAFLKILNQ